MRQKHASDTLIDAFAAAIDDIRHTVIERPFWGQDVTGNIAPLSADYDHPLLSAPTANLIEPPDISGAHHDPHAQEADTERDWQDISNPYEALEADGVEYER